MWPGVGWLWSNDTVVVVLEITLLRVTTPPLATWDDLLPEQATRLPDELAHIDAYLDDERFLAPWRAHFHVRLGRPSIPIPTLLRLLYLKHRYQLGYETLCKEVSDSISWRRFCRIPLDQPTPHPTTLSKLVRRGGPDTIAALNTALLAKLAADKLLRARKLRIDTTVVEADIDYPTDADLLEQAVRTLGGLVRRLKARGVGSRTRFRNRSRSAGRRLKQISQTLRRRVGVAVGEVDRLTAEVATIARRTVGAVAAVRRAAHRSAASRPSDGWLARLAGQLDQTVALTGRLPWQTDQRLAGNRAIPDRVVSLADPDARPIRKGKPRSPTQFGSTLLLGEDERGFVACHQLSTGTPGTARRELERTRAFKRMRNWRVGIEARISHLKRSFGLRRTRLRRLDGASTWVGLGVFAHNLQRMTVVTY